MTRTGIGHGGDHTGMPHGHDPHARPSLDRAQVALRARRLGGQAAAHRRRRSASCCSPSPSSSASGEPAQLFRSYLLNWIYFAVLGLGGLFFVLLQHLTRAGWSVVVRRLAEAIAATLPVLALLFVPLAFGVRAVYPWASEAAAHDHVLAHKSAWLSPGPFVVARRALPRRLVAARLVVLAAVGAPGPHGRPGAHPPDAVGVGAGDDGLRHHADPRLLRLDHVAGAALVLDGLRRLPLRRPGDVGFRAAHRAGAAAAAARPPRRRGRRWSTSTTSAS